LAAHRGKNFVFDSLDEILKAKSKSMTTDIVTGVRQAIQDLVAPEIRQLQGNIAALDARISALEKIQDAKFNELSARFDARFSEVDGRFNQIDARFSEVNARFNEVNTKLDAILNIHNLELRLARLEAQKSA
jgi:vacuolar-type H+-ATPase subunit I/STV1